MSKLKKLAIFALALAVAATTVPFYAVSAANGTGTSSDPILIKTVADLEQLRTDNSGKYYRLENNIYLNDTQNYNAWTASAPVQEDSGEAVAFDSAGWFDGDGSIELVTPENEWTPIENFAGTLDGNGFVIYGLYINSASKAGFIVDNAGTVKKLGFDKFLISSGDTTGAVAAANTGSIIEVYANGKIVSSGNYVGGIAGTNGGTVRDCASYGNTEGIEFVGGIVGLNTRTVQTCFVSGNVKGASSEGAICGDSANIVSGTATVANCFYYLDGASDDNGSYTDNYGTQLSGFSTTVWQFDSENNEFPKLKWSADNVDNRCGEDLYWTLEDGTFTFDGSGEMYEYSETPWNDEASTVTTLNIGKDITEINESILKAISSFENLESINVAWENGTYTTSEDGKFLMKDNEITIGLSEEIPDTATSIGEYAFCGRNIDKIEINTDIDNEGKDYSKPDGSGVVEIKAHAFEDSTLSEITIVGDPLIGESAIPASATIKGFKNTNSEAYSDANGNTFEPLDNFSLHSYQEYKVSNDRFRINEVIAYAGYCDYAMVMIKGEMVKGGNVKVLNQSAKITTVYKYLNSSQGPCDPIEGKYFSTINMTGLPQSGYDYIRFTITPTVYNIYGGEYSTESKVLMYSPEKGVYLPTEPTQDDEDEEDDGGYLKLKDSEGNGVTADWADFYDGVLKFVPDGGDGLIAFWRDFTKSVTD